MPIQENYRYVVVLGVKHKIKIKQIMEKEKTIAQLLQLLLDNKEKFSIGLCGFISNLLDKNIISFIEYKILNDYMKENLPISRPYQIYPNSRPVYGFCWKPHVFTCREKWIIKHIKLNQQTEIK